MIGRTEKERRAYYGERGVGAEGMRLVPPSPSPSEEEKPCNYETWQISGTITLRAKRRSWWGAIFGY